MNFDARDLADLKTQGPGILSEQEKVVSPLAYDAESRALEGTRTELIGDTPDANFRKRMG